MNDDNETCMMNVDAKVDKIKGYVGKLGIFES